MATNYMVPCRVVGKDSKQYIMVKDSNRLRTGTTAMGCLNCHLDNIPSNTQYSVSSLRGYFVSPELKARGMVRGLGRGRIMNVISLNDELVIVICIKGAALINLSSGEALWEIDCPALCGAVSTDGKLLALGSDPDIYLWDLTTGNFLRQIRGHTKKVNTVAFSPDGSTIASGSDDKTVRLWDVDSGRELRQFQGDYCPDIVAFSPDGRSLACGTYPGVWFWDVDSGRELKQFQGQIDDPVNCIAFSPDGRTLAYVIDQNILQLWEIDSGREMRLQWETDEDDLVLSVSFSPDSRTIAYSSRDGIRLWDVASGREIIQLQESIGFETCVDFSPDGRTLVSASCASKVRLWDLASGKQLLQFQDIIATLSNAAFSPDGRTLAFESEDGIRLWDINSGREIQKIKGQGYRSYVTSIAFSPDGRTIASGSDDKTVRLWDVANGKQLRLLQGHANWVKTVAFSPDGKFLVSGGPEAVMRLWEL